jgi:hypothetical protein
LEERYLFSGSRYMRLASRHVPASIMRMGSDPTLMDVWH